MESETFIAFLAAVNVGGRVVKMDRLRLLFQQMGFDNVRTYIQSGNVFFEAPDTDRTEMRRRIERGLRQELGYDVPTMLRTAAEVEAVLDTEPFRAVDAAEDVRRCVLFYSEPLSPPPALPIVSPKGDCELIAVTGMEAFVVVRLVNGRFPNVTPFLSKAIRASGAGDKAEPKATMRFFHTTQKIVRAARGEKV